MRIASLTVAAIFCGILLAGSWITGGAAWNRFSGSAVRRLYYVWTRGVEFSQKVKDPLVTLNGGWNRLLGRRRCNGMLKLPSGHLIGLIGHKKDDARNIREIVSRMTELKDICSESGARMLFVQTPYRNCMLESDWTYPTDATADRADALMNALAAGGVDAIDLRQSLRSAASDIPKMYYKTDNHWTLEAALAMTPEIVCRITGQSDIGTWRSVPLEWRNLGAYGRKTGRWYSGLDDFVYFVPTFRTDLKKVRSDGMVHKTGSFEQLVVDARALEKPESEFRQNVYAVYGGNLNYLRFENPDARYPERLLIIRDSYARPMAAYMAALFKGVVQMDLRDIAKVEDGRKQTVTGVVAAFKPDVVLIMYNSSLMLNPELYHWN